MKVGVVGTGYVGLVTGTCFAELGHHVVCIDIDENKVKSLQNGKCPIYEPGLTELLQRNIKNGRLDFSSNFSDLSDPKVIFIAVGTPADEETGASDLTAFFAALEQITVSLNDNDCIVIKSTVPVGTYDKVKKKLEGLTSKKIYVINNPEFLKEGHAVEDFLRPDRVVVGFDHPEAEKVMDELYAPLAREGRAVLKMSNASAELSKYASNCMLATKISFINEMARLCEVTNADIEEVRKGMIADKRIGPFFLHPGPGYGGSCFPKDVKAIINIGNDLDMPMSIPMAVHQVNEQQKKWIFKKLAQRLDGDLKGLKVAVWGVAFKPNTDDIRESAALFFSEAVLKNGGKLSIYDPVADVNFQKYCEEKNFDLKQIEFHKDQYEAIQDASALVILTDWPEFKSIELQQIKEKMNRTLIFDTRNIIDSTNILKEGIEYMGVGKKVD